MEIHLCPFPFLHIEQDHLSEGKQEFYPCSCSLECISVKFNFKLSPPPHSTLLSGFVPTPRTQRKPMTHYTTTQKFYYNDHSGDGGGNTKETAVFIDWTIVHREKMTSSKEMSHQARSHTHTHTTIIFQDPIKSRWFKNKDTMVELKMAYQCSNSVHVQTLPHLLRHIWIYTSSYRYMHKYRPSIHPMYA